MTNPSTNGEPLIWPTAGRQRGPFPNRHQHAGNLRVLTTMANELLALGASRKCVVLILISLLRGRPDGAGEGQVRLRAPIGR